MAAASTWFVAAVLGVLGAAQTSPAPERPEECQGVGEWVAAAILRQAPAGRPAPPGVELIRQDYGKFMRNRSTIDTPLRIGKEQYARGLGTHSVSRIIIRLPGPGTTFQAKVGIDNNHDTGGVRGSVIFAVERGGKEVSRSDVRRGGQDPLPVRVDLAGSSEFTLCVLDAGDGPAHDHADWAEACAMLQDGRTVWLDEMASAAAAAGLSPATPFSFIYGGKHSAELLPAWKLSRAEPRAVQGGRQHAVTCTDPATGLEAICEVRLFDKYPAVEWLLRFRNGGQADTPILESILPLDARTAGPLSGEVVLHHAHGSTCTATDFLPIEQPLAPKGEIRLAPDGGRSSNGRLPFFNLAWPGGGVVGAIGWSGQWAMRVLRDEGGSVTLQTGQQTTRLKLHPGESIRTPRILLVFWQGDDRLRGHNLLRRCLLDHYVPRLDGQVVVPPITQNTWFTFNTGNDVTEMNQLEAMRPMAPMGVEAYWLDAGWFEGGWPNGVGSWVPKPQAFPRGLGSLGQAAHKAGMRFVVWFEPERVNPNSRIAKEHREWVLRTGGGDGLFNLGDPAARRWLTDHLSRCIADGGIDVYRNDFNIDPLAFWRAADPPDRQGMTEIRYVEGLYAMWDELPKRHPGLFIDNCASGGRRIDLETISRSLPLWRSDTQCGGKPMPVWDQVQTAGLSLYVPLHASGCWGFDPYEFRSIATTGTNICPDTRRPDFPADLAKAAIAEAKGLRPLYLGDYYPLLPIDLDERHWCAWQFDRPELGKGFAVFFRRPKSPYAAVEVALRGLDAKASYDVTFHETYQPRDRRKLTGADLARLRIAIDSAPGSLLVTYSAAK